MQQRRRDRIRGEASRVMPTVDTRSATGRAEPPRIRAFPEWSLPETAADALGRIGPAAVPALVTRLRAPQPDVRRRAIRVLARLGPDAVQAVPELTRLLADDDPEVRRLATRALGQIGPGAASAIPSLIQIMETAADETPTDETPTDGTPSP